MINSPASPYRQPTAPEKAELIEEAFRLIEVCRGMCNGFYPTEDTNDSILRDSRWTHAEKEWLSELHHALLALTALAKYAIEESSEAFLEKDFPCVFHPGKKSAVLMGSGACEQMTEEHVLTYPRTLIPESCVDVNFADDIWGFKNLERLYDHSIGNPVKFSGIYFLLKGSDVIYVGQSVDVGSRLVTHRSSKDFDRYAAIPIRKNYLSEVEAEYILHYKPVLNKSLPKNCWYQSAADAKRTLKIRSKQDVYNTCLELKLEPIVFNGEIYYPVAEMQKALGLGDES